MRTIAVTGSRSDYAAITLTDSLGHDLSTATIRLGVTTNRDVEPAQWYAPDLATYPSAGTAELSLLLDETRAPAGTYWLVADVVDNPTSQPVVASNSQVRTV